MPLHKTINFNSSTQILVWKITRVMRSVDKVVLNDAAVTTRRYEVNCINVGFWVYVSYCRASYNDFDLSYDESEAASKDGKHISITHSYQFSAIIISDQTVVYIELQRRKIIKIVVNLMMMIIIFKRDKRKNT
jgi:hypothetical protein